MIQTSFWAGRLIEESLGGYVYALLDPRDEEFFYIGLAGGISEQGNNRPVGHLNEVSMAINKSSNLNAKQLRIKEIWDSGKEVKLVIIRHNLKRDEALHVEAALIDLLRLGKKGNRLTNIVRGHGRDKYSLIDDVSCIDFMAKPVSPNKIIKNVWLFNISKAIESGKSPYEATIGDWIIAKHHCQFKENEPQYAVGLSRGISRVVIQVLEWNTTDDGKKRKMAGTNLNNDEVGNQLLEKDFSRIIDGVGFWQRGRPIRVNLNIEEFLITYGVNGGRGGQYLA